MKTPVLVRQEKVWTLPMRDVPGIVSELRRRLTWSEVRAMFMPDGFVVFDTVDGLVRMDPETAAPIFPEPEGLLEMDLFVDEFGDEPDLGEHPLPAIHRLQWEDWRIRKGPGNSWKVHRNTRYHSLPSSGSKWDRAR